MDGWVKQIQNATVRVSCKTQVNVELFLMMHIINVTVHTQRHLTYLMSRRQVALNTLHGVDVTYVSEVMKQIYFDLNHDSFPEPNLTCRSANLGNTPVGSISGEEQMAYVVIWVGRYV